MNSSSSTALATTNPQQIATPTDLGAMSVASMLGQIALIQQIMAAAMKDGEHFGKIPGCGDKPTLLKPGAEKLCLTFKLTPSYEVDERHLDEKGNREYRVTCTLTSQISGVKIGEGVGTCSTLEGKYRYRGTVAESTGKPVPRAYWDVRQEDPKKAQELIGGKGFTTKKLDGEGWMICKGGEKLENDNPADVWNTVLKMGKKRALVDAVLTATAASDIFTQDLEDITANMAVCQQPLALAAGDEQGGASSGQTGTPSRGSSGPNGSPAQSSSAVVEAADFRETRIHFGKNRGLMLSELTPQQVHWYETDWMPKKEVNGPTTVEDLALMNALKAYRAWRGRSGSNAVKRDRRDVSIDVEATVVPAAEDESQERPSAYQELCALMNGAGIQEGELTAYLCTKKVRGGGTLMSDEEELPVIPDNRMEKFRADWSAISGEIIAKRKAHAVDAVTTAAALPK